MATSYTSLIGLALPVTGELSGTWGDTVNNYISTYVDSAVAGTQTISGSQTAVTLSVTNGSSLSQAGSGATGSAQYTIINCTGNPAGTLTITAPASSKSYIIINATSTSQSVKIVGAGPTTGVTVASGDKALVAWNGSDFVRVGASAGGSNTQVQYNSSGNLAGSANMTFDGTKLTVANILDSGLTASQAVFTDASKNLVSVATTGSGSVVLGTAPTITLANGTGLPLTTGVSGQLPVANGGTNSNTANGGFNNLSPMTTAGDIIYGGVSGAGTRLGIGSNGYVLTVSSGAPVWAAVSASPAGSTTQFQYNNAGAAAGAANLVYNANGPIVSSLGVGSTTPSASGAGIAFPATQSASTDVNTLDDYEEGTFTPTITFGGASVGITYGSQSGTYTKIGNKVFYFASVTLSSKGSSAGVAKVAGLPFTVSTSYVPGSFLLGSMASITSTLMLQAGSGTTGVEIYQIVSNSYSFIQDTNFTNSTLLSIAGFYTTT